MLGVARHLIDRGHRVRFLTGPAYQDAVKAIGAEFLPLGPGAEYSSEPSAATGVQAIREGIRGLVIEPARGQYLPLEAAIAAEQTDAVLAEVTFMGAATLSRLPRDQRPAVIACGILPLTLSSPDCAPYGSGLAPGKGKAARLRNRMLNWMVSDVVLKDSQQQVDDLTRELVGVGLDGLFILDWARRTELIAQFTVEEFEYPRSDAPDNLRFFGPMSRHAASAAVTPKPEWWGELDGSRPVVYVTQGTVSNEDFTALVGPTLEGLAEEDVTVVVSTGRRPAVSASAAPGQCPGRRIPAGRGAPAEGRRLHHQRRATAASTTRWKTACRSWWRGTPRTNRRELPGWPGPASGSISRRAGPSRRPSATPCARC
jgi:hypothetical protein